MLNFADWIMFLECFGNFPLMEGRMNSPEEQFDLYANQGLREVLKKMLANNSLVNPQSPDGPEIIRQAQEIISNPKYDWGKVLRMSAGAGTSKMGRGRAGSQDIEDIGSEVIFRLFEKVLNPALYTPQKTFADVRFPGGLRANLWTYIKSLTSFESSGNKAGAAVLGTQADRITQTSQFAGVRPFDYARKGNELSRRIDRNDVIEKMQITAKQYVKEYTDELINRYGSLEAMKSHDRAHFNYLRYASLIVPYLVEYPLLHNFKEDSKIGEALSFAIFELKRKGYDIADEMQSRLLYNTEEGGERQEYLGWKSVGGKTQQYLMKNVWDIFDKAKTKYPDIAKALDFIKASLIGSKAAAVGEPAATEPAPTGAV